MATIAPFPWNPNTREEKGGGEATPRHCHRAALLSHSVYLCKRMNRGVELFFSGGQVSLSSVRKHCPPFTGRTHDHHVALFCEVTRTAQSQQKHESHTKMLKGQKRRPERPMPPTCLKTRGRGEGRRWRRDVFLGGKEVLALPAVVLISNATQTNSAWSRFKKILA